MSTKKKLLEAAAGAAGGVTYVDDVFSTYLYDGNSSTQTITNGIDLAGEGGLVWQKGRSTGVAHYLWDTERGSTKRLSTNATGAQVTTDSSWISSFNSDGFSIGNSGSFNTSGQNYASWTFRKQPGFFDIVTYTGSGSTQTISHNLGTTPGFIIIKSTSHGSTYWSCWHRSIPNSYILLNHTQAAQSGVSRTVNDSTFQVMNWNDEGANGRTYVAYLFAHDAQDFGTDSDESIIKCGSYTGNGSTTGPVINLGFEPQWLLVKRTDSTSYWAILDVARGIVYEGTKVLRPNESLQEVSGTEVRFQLTPTGFIAGGGVMNANNGNYIYIAIRRPHKPAEEFAATDLFKAISAVSGGPAWVSGFPVDMNLQKNVIDTAGPYIWSRLTQGQRLQTFATSAESSEGSAVFDYQNGVSEGQGYQLSSQYAWMWRRAPGYFDVVTYTGNGTPNNGYRDVEHNLTVQPEMMLLKRRNSTSEWTVNHKSYGAGYLNRTNAWDAYPVGGNNHNDAFTATTFSAKAQSEWNFNLSGATYIAYLFASTPGISKVGSYTGTGNDLNVDCGFSAGARFVLVKRADSSGDWYVWDSVRGIVAGNDPYLLLNSTATQVTNTDYIDPLSSGFTITSTAPAALNASGGNYIFYAIA